MEARTDPDLHFQKEQSLAVRCDVTSSLPGDEAKQLPPGSKCLLDSGGVQSHSRESTCLLCENGMPAESRLGLSFR